jgi:hypothetical protein
MKKQVLFIVVFAFVSVTFSQSSVSQNGFNYAMYHMNPDKGIKYINIGDFQEKRNQDEYRLSQNQSVHLFNPQESVVLLKQNHLIPGLYKNFEELKNNKPSGEFNYQIEEKIKKYQGNEITSYKLNIDKLKAKEIGIVFGFSDGKNAYLNVNGSKLSSSTEFARLELFGNYAFYEFGNKVSVSSGTEILSVPKIEQKILDVSTGEVIKLNKNNLKDLMSDNPQLLMEFENSPNKERILKDFLLRYLNEKYPD